MKDEETDDDELEPTPSIRIPDTTAKEVFLAWEKLRLVYNAVLFGVVLLRVQFGEQFGTESLILGTFYANLCFCAGPVAEGYSTWLGLDRKVIRFIVFIIGIGLAFAFASSMRDRDLAGPFH